MTRFRVYLGTYTERMPHVAGSAEGVYRAEFDSATGVLTLRDVTRGVTNPSYLALAADGRALYAVEETSALNGSGAVSAFAVAPHDGSLHWLGRRASHGADPCYVALTPDGAAVLVANYSGGTIARLAIEADGRLAAAAPVIAHREPAVQRGGAHPHAILTDASGNWVLVPDLGLNRVLVYRHDTARATLERAADGQTAAPGAGPRHALFGRDGALYVINEIDSTLSRYQFDAATGQLGERQDCTGLPAGWAGTSHAADLRLHPTLPVLYTSHRGHDSVAVYRLDADRPQLVAHVPVGGRTPRAIAVDPTGRWLLAAHQDSSSIQALPLDPASGVPSAEGPRCAVPTPVCIVFGAVLG